MYSNATLSASEVDSSMLFTQIWSLDRSANSRNLTLIREIGKTIL